MESLVKLQKVPLPDHGGVDGMLHVGKRPVISDTYEDFGESFYNFRIFASCPDAEECQIPEGAFNNVSGNTSYRIWDVSDDHLLGRFYWLQESRTA